MSRRVLPTATSASLAKAMPTDIAATTPSALIEEVRNCRRLAISSSQTIVTDVENEGIDDGAHCGLLNL